MSGLSVERSRAFVEQTKGSDQTPLNPETIAQFKQAFYELIVELESTFNQKYEDTFAVFKDVLENIQKEFDCFLETYTQSQPTASLRVTHARQIKGYVHELGRELDTYQSYAKRFEDMDYSAAVMGITHAFEVLLDQLYPSTD